MKFKHKSYHCLSKISSSILTFHTQNEKTSFISCFSPLPLFLFITFYYYFSIIYFCGFLHPFFCRWTIFALVPLSYISLSLPFIYLLFDPHLSLPFFFILLNHFSRKHDLNFNLFSLILSYLILYIGSTDKSIDQRTDETFIHNIVFSPYSIYNMHEQR